MCFQKMISLVCLFVFRLLWYELKIFSCAFDKYTPIEIEINSIKFLLSITNEFTYIHIACSITDASDDEFEKLCHEHHHHHHEVCFCLTMSVNVILCRSMSSFVALTDYLYGIHKLSDIVQWNLLLDRILCQTYKFNVINRIKWSGDSQANLLSWIPM